jgi:autotransporter-associated beta strand protein
MFAPGNGEYSMAIVDAGASWRNIITQFDSKDSADAQIQNAAGRSIAPTLFINYTTSTLPVVTISATDPDATEAGADAGQFRISRGDALSGALTVNYTIGGTAAAGDYTPALAGSVVIPDGAAAAFININAVNDTDSEGPETLVLTLTSGTGYNIGAASAASVNIADDDRTVVQINATDPDAHETGPDSGQFTVVRNHNTGNLTVNYSISGTTTSADYMETLGGSVVIPDGSYTATITVTPVNDPDVEADETLILSLNATNDYQLGAATAATVSFRSEDLPVTLPVVTISANDPDASEAGADAGQFSVSRGEALSGALTVNYTIGGTAAAGDYTPALPGSVVIPNGQTSAVVDVTPLDDLLDESNETIVLTAVSGAGYTVGSPAAATVIIADDDVTPGLAWSGATDTAWATGTNWVGGSAPASSLTTDIANFNLPTYGGNPVYAPTAPNSQKINGITIGGNNGAMLLSTGAGTSGLQIGASGITVAASAGALSIGQGNTATVLLGANQTWNNNSSSLMTFRALSNTGGNYTVTLAGSGTGGYRFSNTIQDRSAVFTNAVEVDYTTGTVELLGANTFTAGLRIKGGQVIVGNNNALGLGTVTLGYGGGSSAVSIMNNAATKSYSAPIFLESTHSGTVTIGSTSGQATFTGGVTGTHNLIVGATADVIFSTAGLNYTGNLTKNGGGTLSLGAANTFGGIALVQAGTLRLDHVNALQNATLDTGTSGAQAVTFNLAGANTYNLGGLQGADALAIGGNTISVGNNNASTTFSGAISGTLGVLTKVGNGTLTLSSATNGYTGATHVEAGTLKLGANDVLPNTITSTLSIGAATLDASTFDDTVGTLDAAGSAVINLGSGANLAFAASNAVDWTGGTLNITGTFVSGSSLRFGTSSSGLTSTQLGLITALGWSSFALDASGYLTAVPSGIDMTAPTLTGIVDNVSGGPVIVGALVTYTVTFNEEINASTVNAEDFNNQGTAAVTIGTVNETSPGVFSVPVTPTGAGTLQLRIPTGAVLADTSANNLVVPVADDTTLTVQTAYDAWAGGALFDADTNGDGVQNGLAFLLGAANKDINALSLLPTVTQSSGNLILNFSCLNAAKRGSTVLKVQYSKDLGITDLWNSHLGDSAVVPGTAPTSVTVGGVDFVSSVFDADKNNMQATIPASAASPGTKLFGRLKAEQN